MVGPVFNRIWDTPDNGYAEKFKHSIEPFLTVQRTSSIDNFDRIIQLDGTDYFVGGTQFTYGLNNRFYAKRKLTPGAQAQAREIFDVELSQSYYTNPRAAQYDRQYQTSFSRCQPEQISRRSPSACAPPRPPSSARRCAQNSTARPQPANDVDAGHLLAGHALADDGRLEQAGSSSGNAIIDPTGLTDQYSNIVDHRAHEATTSSGASTVQLRHPALRMLQQRMSAFYNAQCCGLALEYQTFNFGGVSGSTGIPADHRFFLSFTLAGLGNFSPFNGALSGVPR